MQYTCNMTSNISKTMTTHDESHVTVAREIGRKASASNHEGENQYNADDIHTAALVDNPLHAERPSATTILAILVRSISKFQVCAVEEKKKSL